MFDYKHYVPILRWKQAEKDALCKLYIHDKAITNLIPLIELVPTKGRKKSARQIADEILEYWGQDRIFLDYWHLPKTHRSRLLGSLGNEGQFLQLSLIPVTGLDKNRTNKYQSVVASLIKNNRLGVCLRLLINDVQKPAFQNQLSDLLTYFKVKPNEVDIVVDYQFIDNKSPKFHTISNLIPHIHDWRTFTLAGGNFPRYLTDYNFGEEHKLVRLDWAHWIETIQNSARHQRKPSYSDYTVQHPILYEPPEAPHISASIRYTSHENWVIMRGRSIRLHGHNQYPAQASLLRERPEYCGEKFSFGDDYIMQRSLELEKPDGIEKTGNPTTWIRAAINHHMAFVLHQIANLPY